MVIIDNVKYLEIEDVKDILKFYDKLNRSHFIYDKNYHICFDKDYVDTLNDWYFSGFMSFEDINNNNIVIFDLDKEAVNYLEDNFKSDFIDLTTFTFAKNKLN